MDQKRFKGIIEEVLVDHYVDDVETLSEEIVARLNEEFSMFDEEEEEEEDEF